MSSFNKIFAHRSVVCFFVLMIFLLSGILRVAVIATDDYTAAQSAQSALRIPFSRPRGVIYDCNKIPLSGGKPRIVAAVSPRESAIMTLRKILKDENDLPRVLEELSHGKPVVCTVKEAVDCDGIICTTVYDQPQEKSAAVHTLGYLDADGHGVGGLQAAFDDLLYCEETCDAVFYTDGRGKPLKGLSAEFENPSGNSSGIVTTLDLTIQQIAEQTADKLTRGAIVVCDVESGKIRALVSRPTFDPQDPAAALDGQGSPFLNRTLSVFSVGSVFKPCVAAAALENGTDGAIHHCTGGLAIAERTFRCHNRSGHGAVDLSSALAFSCNTFFYQLALSMGGDPLYRMASSLSFGQSIRLCSGLETVQGRLPQKRTLQNEGALANLSIGQGELLLSPVALTTLYCAVAGNGTYRLPTLIEATLQDGSETVFEVPHPTRVMSKHSAERLRQDLIGVISGGTGIPAKPQLVSAGGKTATAQTGQFDENGREITYGWFCGFFPAENPKYVAVIFSENASGSDTAPIFAELADEIFAMKMNDL